MRGGAQACGLGFLMLLLSAGSGCDGAGNPDGGPGGFDDHTVDRVTSAAQFAELGAPGASSTALKFIIANFGDGAAQQTSWLDSKFYKLHDEWYWFRLLNNVAVDGVDTRPVDLGFTFESVDDIVVWARTQAVLPLDLTFVSDGRLYSPRFYELALFNAPKQLGIGTVLHFPARPEVELEEQWAFELEFQHVLTRTELVSLFAALEPALPEGVGPRLKLLVRSPGQEEFVQQLEAAGDPLADRVLRYDEVTVPGEVEVYSGGLIAGRLRVVRSGESFEDARSTDILVTEDMPDFLPQCAGLITNIPQYELAHVNILAKNRGIPNAYRGGIVDDPNIDQLARVRAPVIVKASKGVDGAADALTIVGMTETEFSQFRALTVVPPSAVTPVDITTIERTYDLEALSFADESDWRPKLGGKSVGYLAILDAEDITAPPRPLGISIKPYKESIAALEPQLQAMLQDTEFNADANVRLLVLEGANGWAARHPEDPSFPALFLGRRPPGDTLRALVEAGGVTGRIRNLTIPAAVLDDIVDALETNFGGYAPEQGLRFRSSSNVEDAEGFNGAGLYTSNTGYLRADEIGQSKTVPKAIKETWASYWGSEAFEERRLANVAHLSGAMGLAVHANFQDELELSNAVFTYTILPPGHPDGAAVLEINVQDGALSVTNPPPGDDRLPEVSRVILDGAGATSIVRDAFSTAVPEGELVLSDAQLLHVFDEARRVTELWLAVENDQLPASQERSTLTLDFELREVAQGWPALANGNSYGERLVIKQARTLEPSLVRVPGAVQAMPIPRDVLARALRVEERTCATTALDVSVTEVFTDSRKSPDLGFERAPFVGFVVVEFNEDVPELGAVAGQRRSAVHTAFSADHPGLDEGANGWQLELVVDAAAVAQTGISRVAWDGSALVVEREGAAVSALSLCDQVDVLFASPEQFLEGILASRQGV